jgi:hypothetical protein
MSLPPSAAGTGAESDSMNDASVVDDDLWNDDAIVLGTTMKQDVGRWM